MYYLLVTGGKDEANDHDDILELIDSEWRQVASLENARAATAVSVVNVEDYWKYCTF